MSKKQKKVLVRIIAALMLLAGVILLDKLASLPQWAMIVLYLVPYFLIGYDILWKALKGIKNRQAFDENFLMAVATVGALCLQDFKEGVAVMLFYQIGELFQSVAVGKSRKNIAALMDIRPDYANVMVETKDPEDAAEVEQQFYEHMTQNFPNIITRSALFALSPVPEAAIEIGFIGENPDTLTALVERAKKIARQCDMVTDIRSNWGDKVPVWKPMFSQQKGLRLGITRQQVANSFRTATNGLPLGEYREGDVSLPILLKDEDVEKMNLNDVKSVPVFSTKGNSVKVEQVIDNFALGYDYNVVRRFNRERCMMMQCEPKRGANTMAAFKQVLTAVQEQMQLPEGYKMKYFGEQETQDVSNAALAKNIPLTFLLIYVVLLFLFPSNYRKPVLIMLMLPLVFIGVVWGLLLFGKSLDFFAILGLLGLIGMNIKNAIVLVDEIGLQLKDGKGAVPAVVEATKTRIVPVTMASGTTILGMLPLLGDAMFAGMAATIMGGLFVSTVLTIFVLPVTYCIFFKIRADR